MLFDAFCLLLSKAKASVTMFYCLLVEIVSCKMLKIKVVTFSSCVTFYSKWQVKTFIKKNRVVIMRENFFLLLDSVKEKKAHLFKYKGDLNIIEHIFADQENAW